MAEKLTYFISDVHLGLQTADVDVRYQRFLKFLKGIDTERVEALYMLGDIWDFWYEWKNVIPKDTIEVLVALKQLTSAGVKVYFFPGNHDIWAYGFFEELGVKIMTQPEFVTIGDKSFCLAHGDTLGKMTKGYRFMRGCFTSKLCQWAFSHLLHPDFAMSIGHKWSRNNRLAHRGKYQWKGQQENLYKYACSVLEQRHVDYFVFGHLHVKVREPLPGGATLIILDSWLYSDEVFVFPEAI